MGNRSRVWSCMRRSATVSRAAICEGTDRRGSGPVAMSLMNFIPASFRTLPGLGGLYVAVRRQLGLPCRFRFFGSVNKERTVNYAGLMRAAMVALLRNDETLPTLEELS